MPRISHSVQTVSPSTAQRSTSAEMSGTFAKICSQFLRTCASPGEPPLRMGRRLVAVVGSEAVDERLEIVVVRRPQQSLDHRFHSGVITSSLTRFCYSRSVTDSPTMERSRRLVKTKRPYDSAGRRGQAERSRATILDTAQRLFLEDGYATTTMAAIATAADVSVETIYKSFGSKTGLVRAIRDRGLAGAGPRPADERSDEMRRSRDGSPRRSLRTGAP